MKPFVKVCESEVLRRAVVVCCGPEPIVKKLFLDPKTYPGFNVSRRFLAGQWRAVEKSWHEARESPGGATGITITVHEGGGIFVVIPKWDSRVFIHEAYHAVQAVLRLMGTQDEELGAYLMAWLFKEICWVSPERRKERK